ncbi:MAG: hypothetical protein M1142_00955 [Patescibacteria group bacterium]|nr:hypothetical protein [Patescibacteria group bacterium]
MEFGTLLGAFLDKNAEAVGPDGYVKTFGQCGRTTMSTMNEFPETLLTVGVRIDPSSGNEIFKIINREIKPEVCRAEDSGGIDLDLIGAVSLLESIPGEGEENQRILHDPALRVLFYPLSSDILGRYDSAYQTIKLNTQLRDEPPAVQAVFLRHEMSHRQTDLKNKNSFGYSSPDACYQDEFEATVKQNEIFGHYYPNGYLNPQNDVEESLNILSRLENSPRRLFEQVKWDHRTNCEGH